jgi:hypothetical protein
MPPLWKKLAGELRPIFNPAGDTIEGITPGSWDSPLQPIQPFTPPNMGFRSWDFTPGLNLTYQPRGDQRVTFQQLRHVAQSFDLCAMVIDKKKREIGSKKWQIRLKPVPGEKKGDYKGRETKSAGEIQAITSLFEFPDGHHSFQQWINMWLDDVLICDAGSILPVKNLLGDVFQLRVISGSTITPLIDEQGFVPTPPNPAYQQIILGLPTNNIAGTQVTADKKAKGLTQDQLVYRPRNPRPFTRWGCSPVERIIVTLDIASRRQQFLKDYYTEGNVPEGFLFAPDGWTPDQIKQFQTWLDNLLAGNLAKRRRLIMAPAGKTSGHSVEWAKQQALTDTTEDYLVKLVCYCFDESPQNLIKQMNRASAEKSAEVSKESGEVSLAAFTKDTLNYIIQYLLKKPDLEFEWESEEDVDPAVQEVIIASKVNTGRMTRNEARELDGMDPSDEPMANELTVTAGATIILLDQIGQQMEQDQQQAEEKESTSPANKAHINHASFKGHEFTSGSMVAKTRMQSTLSKFFKAQAQRVAKSIAAGYGKVKKDDKTNKLIEDADFGWYQLIHEIEGDLVYAAEQGVLVGAQQALTSYGADSAVVQRVAGSYARKFAEDRAAELVGMKRAGNDWVDNPEAKWAISETTRDDIKKTVAQAFEEGWTKSQLAAVIEGSQVFSNDRAEMIAKTEIARSQSFGNLQSWVQSGVITKTKWQVSADHKCCDNCDLYALKGSVAVGHEYAPGVFAPPDAHPNCECALVVTEVKK